MANVIVAPNENYTLRSEIDTKLFVAGGISNCPDWQTDFIREFINFPKLNIYNPRQEQMPAIAEEQIVWEHRHMREADVIVFWFSVGSVNPITLYELGLFITSDKHIVIGLHPDYERKEDVEIQAKLIRDIKIAKNWEQFIALTKQTLSYATAKSA